MWTGLAPWEFEFPFPGSLISTFRRHMNIKKGQPPGKLLRTESPYDNDHVAIDLVARYAERGFRFIRQRLKSPESRLKISLAPAVDRQPALKRRGVNLPPGTWPAQGAV